MDLIAMQAVLMDHRVLDLWDDDHRDEHVEMKVDCWCGESMTRDDHPMHLARAMSGAVDWHLGEARSDALLDAAHGISLVTNPYLERDAVIRVLEQWGTDPARLVPRPKPTGDHQQKESDRDR